MSEYSSYFASYLLNNQYMIYSCQIEVTKQYIHLHWLLPEIGGCAVTKVTTVATIGQTHINTDVCPQVSLLSLPSSIPIVQQLNPF